MNLKLSKDLVIHSNRNVLICVIADICLKTEPGRVVNVWIALVVEGGEW